VARGVALGAVAHMATSVVLVSGCATAPTATSTPVVQEVVDGDTVVLAWNGHTETARLIGVDTPETKHPTKPVECYGPEASAFTQRLLPRGTAVRVERDREPRDHFGRVLVYVHRLADGVFVNVELARAGFARPLPIAPNTAHAAEVDDATRDAKANGRGLWAACEQAP
jgi:micrococcal nuclease